MKDNAPSSLTTGATTRISDQMAEYRNAKDKIKAIERRMTPYDVKVAGTFAERPHKERDMPRDPTPAERKANNTAMVNAGNVLGDIGNWVPMFMSDLMDMNRNKVGRPFDFSDSMIWWIVKAMTLFDSTFRLISGFVAGVMKTFGLKAPSYSRLQERATELVMRMLDPVDDEITERYGSGVLAVHVCGNVSTRVRRLGIDSSGMNLSGTTLWRSRKWKTFPKDRGWLKIHALCDVDTGEIVAYAITSESVGDAPLLKILAEAAEDKGHLFDVMYADGAYSSVDNWIFLCRERDIRFVTGFRCDTVPNNNGSSARGDAARLWCSLPYDEWVEVSGYGTRWKCECVFSDLKRIFPETVTARSSAGILRQIGSRIEMFNLYKIERARIMEVTGNGIIVA